MVSVKGAVGAFTRATARLLQGRDFAALRGHSCENQTGAGPRALALVWHYEPQRAITRRPRRG